MMIPGVACAMRFGHGWSRSQLNSRDPGQERRICPLRLLILQHDLMAALALHLGHKADTATVMLKGGIVKSLLGRQFPDWAMGHE